MPTQLLTPIAHTSQTVWYGQEQGFNFRLNEAVRVRYPAKKGYTYCIRTNQVGCIETLRRIHGGVVHDFFVRVTLGTQFGVELHAIAIQYAYI